MASYNYGSQPTPVTESEGATPKEYPVEYCDEPQFVSFVSPESPDGILQISNNITGEPLGNLELERSGLYKRRKHSKSNYSTEPTPHDQPSIGMEAGITKTSNGGKRIRSGTCEASQKSKKIKINPENDKTDEGSNGFSHLTEFLSNIQYLNDGTLNFELDVSYEHFKLKVEYSFE